MIVSQRVVTFAGDAEPQVVAATEPGTTPQAWWATEVPEDAVRRPAGPANVTTDGDVIGLVSSLTVSTVTLSRSRSADFVELTKPRLTALVLVTTFAGFYLASPAAPDLWLLVRTLLGTALVAGGAAVLNQYLERDVDALMSRTRCRPLPTGRVTPHEALAFGVLLCVIGLMLLAVGVGLLASLLAAVSVTSYLFCYTPMKRRTSLCTLVGGIPGGLPPLIGWAAARGSVGVEAWSLFTILFLWQQPHFLAIAWLYRDDYVRAGLPMLPVVDDDGASTGRQALLYALALVPVSLLPVLQRQATPPYVVGALALGIAFCVCGAALANQRSRPIARRLFVASLIYLPALLACWMLNKPSL